MTHRSPAIFKNSKADNGDMLIRAANSLNYESTWTYMPLFGSYYYLFIKNTGI